MKANALIEMVLNGHKPDELVEESIYLDKKDAEYFASIAFPSYRGNKFQVKIEDTYTVDTESSGGTSNSFVLLKTMDGQVRTISSSDLGLNVRMPVHQDVKIPDDVMVVEHSYFTGKDMGLRFYVSPNSTFLPKMISAPKEELTPQEMIVLIATRSLKAGYAGDRDSRFHSAEEETGITKEEWESAKASLIAKRHLNKAGAITTSGRNVAGDKRLDNYGLGTKDTSSYPWKWVR
jgi:hypothetical protein